MLIWWCVLQCDWNLDEVDCFMMSLRSSLVCIVYVSKLCA